MKTMHEILMGAPPRASYPMQNRHGGDGARLLGRRRRDNRKCDKRIRTGGMDERLHADEGLLHGDGQGEIRRYPGGRNLGKAWNKPRSG